MDPLSLIAMASTTFKGIQVLVNKGAEIEHVAQKLGQWYSFASDIKEAEREAESPGIFKKLFDGNTIEQQALNSVIAKKKLEEQEKQIRELIVWSYGVETYQEMIMLRRKIKAQREQAIYKQRKRQRMLLDSVIVAVGFAVSSGKQTQLKTYATEVLNSVASPHRSDCWTRSNMDGKPTGAVTSKTRS